MRKGISVWAEIPLIVGLKPPKWIIYAMRYKGTKIFETNKSFPFTFPTKPTIYMKTRLQWNTKDSTETSQMR